MRTPRVMSKADLVLELFIAVGVQLGLSRLLAAACTSAEEHEFEPGVSVPPQVRSLARPAVSALV